MQEAPCVIEQHLAPRASLKDRVAQFNAFADNHQTTQALNPFSQNKNVSSLEKRRFSKEEYGRPQKGSKSEMRGFKATLEILKETLQLCEILNKHAVSLIEDEVKKVICFGELFAIYTTISSKLVGILLRARKQNLIEFEGEVLFQRKDDEVPITLIKTIEEIREILNERIRSTMTLLNMKDTQCGEFFEKEQ
ncbi:hypothetical protein FQA39_LY15293 [Lamprigera yunnana]|nr:hypothetical protein FQA39_LY15293 [Lamprigera yunnana]